MKKSLGVVIAALMIVVPNWALEENDSSREAAAPSTTTGANAASLHPALDLSGIADPLLRVLIQKGVLTASEAVSIAAVPTGPRNQLLLLLKNKGILSAEDMASLEGAPANPPAPAPVEVAPRSVEPAAPQAAAAGPAVIPAVMPLRVLAADPPKREGLIPDIKIGDKVRIKPYGFFKATAIYDSSSPYGNDFPLPGFISDINGPDKMSEFHMKVRSSRIGTNFEWLDIAPDVTVTGKFEMDFEGDFTRVGNRNISSIRSSQPSIRLAYGRVDWAASDKATLFALFGQDWTPFGSSTLPNLLESTGLGLAFGTLYERDPQFRFGVNLKKGGSRNLGFTPEIAVVLPTAGNLPANLCSAPAANGATTVACSAANPALATTGVENQLAYGERQGPDSARPQIQARFVTQFQLDRAAGVAPAQVIVSGMQGERSAVVLAAEVPAAFRAAFPSGTRVVSDTYGLTVEAQLPTRFATVTSKYYLGGDLRYYFAGQLFSTFNDTAGLTGTANSTSIDGSSTVVFGVNGAGASVAAPQRPVRARGGFLNIGVPLSRLAAANPAGRNAGWTLYAHYGFDEALARDVRRIAAGRMRGDLFAGQLQYKMNSLVTFAMEESLYRTRTVNTIGPIFGTFPTREWKDLRTEIGPIFTF